MDDSIPQDLDVEEQDFLKECIQKTHANYSIKNRHILSLTLTNADQEILIPESIGKLRSLKTLALRKSYCTRLPTSMENLPSLEIVKIESPLGASLPQNLDLIPNVKTLFLTGGNFVRLPKTIGKLKSLMMVILSDCESLASLPAEIGSWVNIRELNVNNCPALAELPLSIGSWKEQPPSRPSRQASQS